MKTFAMAFTPGVIAGALTIFTSRLSLGVILHRFRERTPDTWRLENNVSYALSSALHFLACIVTATFFLCGRALARKSLRFGAIIWMTLAAPLAVATAIFIRLRPWVVVGQLLDWPALLPLGGRAPKS